MSRELIYIMAMSCTIPAVAGIYRSKRIERKFYPFIFMMILDMVIETFLYLVYKYAVMPNFAQLAINMYVIIGFALFLYLVYINDYVTKKVIQLLLIAGVIITIANYFHAGTLFSLYTYLICFIWSVNLIISIDILSRQIMSLSEKLHNNFWFWTSSAFILYNSFNLLVFAPVFFIQTDNTNGKAIGNIQHFANVACYIFFTIAIFKIPKKKIIQRIVKQAGKVNAYV